MIDSYKELLYNNQILLAELKQEKQGHIFNENVPLYQNPNIKRSQLDPYQILRYRQTNGEYRELIIVNFDKLPGWLRGSTPGFGSMDINENDYEPYDVMSHEMMHILNRNKPEYWIRAYSPRGIRSLEEFKLRFPRFDFVITRRM